MTIHFVGGPYDGLRLDDHQVAGLTLLVPVRGPAGIRLFTLMPPLARWRRVRRGQLGRDESMPNYAYEWTRTATGFAFRDAEANGSFDLALSHRWRE